MGSTEQKICRFCFLSLNSLINIFDDESEANLVEIIAEHIGEVNQYDTLPRFVCIECWRRIEDFHNFHRSALNAQEEYLKRAVKSEIEIENEIEREPDPDHASSSHETIKPPNFIEVFASCEEFNEFAEVAIKAGTEFDDKNQQGIELQNVDDLFNGTSFATEHEESNAVACDKDDCDNDYYEEENDDQEADPKYDLASDSKASDEVDATTKRKIFAENFDTTCDICSIDLKSLKRAVSHYKHEHDSDEGYIKCCGLKLKQDYAVNDHIRWHINPEIFKCRYCGRLMKSRNSLLVHELNHRRPRDFSCDICGKVFARLNQIKIHMATHSRSTVCPICRKNCTSLEKFDFHMKFYHKSDEVRKQWQQMVQVKKTELMPEVVNDVIATYFNMKCDHCDSVFKSLQEAQYHYMHEHEITDGYIQCCGVKFRQAVAIEGHALYHTRPELFVCCICQKKSKTTRGLRSHFRVHETQGILKENTCSECNKSFSTKKTMKRHLEGVHGIVASIRRQNKNPVAPDSDAMKSFFDMNCDVCETQLSSLQHAQLHYLEEHYIPDGYIKCCQMRFKDLKSIKQHLEYHVNPNIFKCHICFKKYRRKSALSSHMTYHKNLESAKFSCDVCGRLCKSNNRLQAHKQTHQNKVNRTQPCNHCDRKFSSVQALVNHVHFVHNNSLDRAGDMCEFCGKQFLSRSGILGHIRTAHPNEAGCPVDPNQRVNCEICNTSFVNKYRLKKHVRTIHQGTPVKCTKCDKIAPNDAALNCHMRKVHVAQSYQCRLCPKSFKAAVALKDHIATHTGDKTYKCSFCPEAFIWRPNMYSHQKKAHPDEWKALKTQQRK